MSTHWLSPGASGARGTTNASDYLHVLVLRSRNAKELIEQRNKSNDSCFILPHVIPMALWPHCSLPKNSFLYSIFKGGLWITSAPDCEVWWLELNSESAGTVQSCPVLLLFFSNQIHKAKSLQYMRVIIILSRPLNLQSLFEASKREHIPFIQASLRPRPRSASGSLKKHKAHI